jgi:hypothetical protein
MTAIRIIPDRNYRGEGISEGLARGLLVMCGPDNLTGEGMGIGSVAIKGDCYTCFSRTFTDTGEESHFTRTFFLDTKMSWSFLGTLSPRLTRMIEAAIGVYMQVPAFQKALMAPVTPLRKMLRIHPVYEPIPVQAKVRFTYSVDDYGVDIFVQIDPVFGYAGTLCLLNELSGDCFTSGWDSGMVCPPPPGWERLPGCFPTASLYDPVRGIRFWIDSFSVIPQVPVTLFRGREIGEDLSWAGLSFEIGYPKSPAFPLEFRYRVGIADGVYP